MKYVYWSLAVTMITLVTVINSLPKNGVKENMERGELQYSTELGLVNWEHARPEGTLKAFTTFQELLSTATDTVVYAYAQQTKMRLGILSLVVAYEEERKIPPHLTSEEQKIVFFEIFTSVSTAFEDMQAQIPLAIVPGCRDSSYRPGDLMGNLVSYYSTVSGESLAQIKSKLTLWPAETGYQKYQEEQGDIPVPKNWQSSIGTRKNTNAMLRVLQKIIDATENKATHRSITIQGRQKIYVKGFSF